MSKENIELKGVRVNNLKNIDLQLPLGKFTVITGVSGSGKSSLAFDTLYAEGQRRYVESLSAYARQFLGRMSKPECDYIKSLPPAIAIEQRVNTRNPRSTVGTAAPSQPVSPVGFGGTPMDMPALIEILMLATAAIILLCSGTDGISPTRGSVFIAGMQAVIAIFGIAWMGDTFINGNIAELTGAIKGFVTEMPWLFALALFVMSILLYSQAATVRAVMPLGIALGISPMMLIALFPAVNGYFFIPNYPTVVAAINFDSTGTTRIGKYILNHSFMMPGLVATTVAILAGILLIQIY